MSDSPKQAIELTMEDKFNEASLVGALERTTPKDFEQVKGMAISLARSWIAMRASARYFAGAPSLLPDRPSIGGR
jgi:hypothetical protein